LTCSQEGIRGRVCSEDFWEGHHVHYSSVGKSKIEMLCMLVPLVFGSPPFVVQLVSDVFRNPQVRMTLPTN